MKNVLAHMIAIGICVIVIALSIWIDKWMFETVVAADWPGWVKYLLLVRGGA